MVRYRSWVYGLGFGVQLGLGVVTIVTTSAIYAMLLAAALSGSAAAGALIGGVFGFVRAAVVFAVAGVKRPEQLGGPTSSSDAGTDGRGARRSASRARSASPFTVGASGDAALLHGVAMTCPAGREGRITSSPITRATRDQPADPAPDRRRPHRGTERYRPELAARAPAGRGSSWHSWSSITRSRTSGCTSRRASTSRSPVRASIAGRCSSRARCRRAISGSSRRAGRAFCLYVVLGTGPGVDRRLVEADRALSSLELAPRETAG